MPLTQLTYNKPIISSPNFCKIHQIMLFLGFFWTNWLLKTTPFIRTISMKFKKTAYLVMFLTLVFISSCSSTKTVPTTQAIQQNTQITSFSKSKKLLLKLYKDHAVTLYFAIWAFNSLLYFFLPILYLLF